jgi:hypothetical protein
MNTEHIDEQLFVLMLAKFPEFDPKWPDEFQAEWFKTFQQMLELAKQLECDRPRP